jgi:hypothetical protein
MPRYPDAVWRPVDRYQTGSLRIPITPRRFVHHTAVSAASSMHDFFNQPDQPTPHFYVNEQGDVEQYIDTDYRATACLDGNDDCIAIESWDGGPSAFKDGKSPAWTDAQVEALATLVAWCHKTHDIPLVVCDASPGSRGVTWHRKGIDGNFPPGLLSGRNAGDEHWSTSAGKVCPGDSKIRGVVDDIIPRAIEISNGDDMSAEDVQHINDHTDAAVKRAADRVVEVVRNQGQVAAKQRARALAAIDSLAESGLTKKDVRAAVEKALAADATGGTP